MSVCVCVRAYVRVGQLVGVCEREREIVLARYKDTARLEIFMAVKINVMVFILKIEVAWTSKSGISPQNCMVSIQKTIQRQLRLAT